MQHYRKHTVISPDKNITVFLPRFAISDCDNLCVLLNFIQFT